MRLKANILAKRVLIAPKNARKAVSKSKKSANIAESHLKSGSTTLSVGFAPETAQTKVLEKIRMAQLTNTKKAAATFSEQ